MKIYLRDEDDAVGYEIADVDPREVEAVFEAVRLQRVHNHDTGDDANVFSWQFVYGDTGAFAEIIMHPDDEGEMA